MIDRSKWREELKPRLPKTSWSQPECDDGWRDLVCDLVEALDKTGVPYEIAQVKEKWGELRFYVDAPDGHKNSREFFRLIEEAEEKSSTTCETCGKPAELRNTLCVKTLCDPCLEMNKKSDFRFMGKPK